MASGFQQSAMPDFSFQAVPDSNAPFSIDFMNYPQPVSLGSDYGSVLGNPEGQGLPSMSPHGDAFTGQNFLPDLDSIYLGSTLPPENSSNIADTTNPLDNVSTSPLASMDASGEIARQWSNSSNPINHPNTTSPPYLYYDPSSTQAMSLFQITPFTASDLGHAISQIDNRRQHSPTHNPVVGNMPAGISAAVPTTASRATAGHFRHATMIPQPGSSVRAQQRRHQRTSTLATASGASVSGLRQVRSTQSVRQRTRPANLNVAPPSLNIPTTQQAPSLPRGRQVPVVPRHDQPAQQQAPSDRALVQDTPVAAWIHNLSPSDQALLQAHISQSARTNLNHYVPPSRSPKKGLDVPQEIRPEPKETDELTINMECKICMGQLVDTVLLPCGHATLCRWCADQHIPSVRGFPKGKATCPMCREPVRQKCRIYFP
ncbi:hypothetical protein BJX61DRAFT_540988 [Aspergillus egyptiacus]|nr:hypothetical protein BJX61DRAFT_540988 [Aspergillus egyptiacus]